MSAKASLSFDIYLRATPRQVRAVLGDPAFAPRWLAGIEFQPGREEDPRRLTREWLQSDHLEANRGSASVVRFESAAMGQVTRLTVTHTELAPGGAFLDLVAAGWPMILSSLKSLIETGRPLDFGHQLAIREAQLDWPV
jgi:Activator of Hsp90 ATPase homolog 1-like protein